MPQTPDEHTHTTLPHCLSCDYASDNAQCIIGAFRRTTIDLQRLTMSISCVCSYQILYDISSVLSIETIYVAK